MSVRGIHNRGLTPAQRLAFLKTLKERKRKKQNNKGIVFHKRRTWTKKRKRQEKEMRMMRLIVILAKLPCRLSELFPPKLRRRTRGKVCRLCSRCGVADGSGKCPLCVKRRYHRNAAKRSRDRKKALASTTTHLRKETWEEFLSRRPGYAPTVLNGLVMEKPLLAEYYESICPKNLKPYVSR